MRGGKGDFGEENQDLKNGGGEEYQVVWNFIHSCEIESVDLHQLLLNHGLAKYIEVFSRHEIEVEAFVNLTDEELREIGIPTFGNY